MSNKYEVIPASENNRITSFGSEDDAKNINPAVMYLLSLEAETSKTTMDSFLNIVARMLGYNTLYDCDWPSMRRHHVQMIIEMLKNSKRAPSTINTYLSALKSVAYEAWCLKQIDGDTLERIKAVKTVKGTRLQKGRALLTDEIKALIQCCNEDCSAIGVRDKTILTVLIGCGLRRSEVVGLDMSSIIAQEKAFKVLGKGNKERISYMPPAVWENIQTWIGRYRGDGSGPLFPRIRKNEDVTSERVTSQAVHYLLEKRQIQAGIKKCAPHDLRRTYATIMIEDGVDIMTIKDSMGHASVNTTERYLRHGNDKMKKAAEGFKGF